MSRSRACWRLLRVPNLFTAAADPWAGFLVVGGSLSASGEWLWLMFASVCFYAGGVVLNDACDAAQDAIERPGRPIPSGAVSRRSAVLISIVLLGVGIAVCFVVPGAGWLGLLLACFIVGYDSILKHTPVGPAAMGGCRALNLLLGASLGGEWSVVSVFCAGVYWAYAASVTYFARFEASESSRVRLRLGTVGVIASVLALVGLEWILPSAYRSFLLGVGTLAGLLTIRSRAALRTREPSDVRRAVKSFVLSTVFFDACLVLAARGPWLGFATAVFWLPAAFLGRRVAVT